MPHLFLDCETTGLPPKNADWRTDFKQFPFLVSIAWKFGAREVHYIVHSKTVVVTKDMEAIHGIDTKALRASIHEFDKIMKELVADARKAEKIIGFNTYFDTSIIKANCLRLIGDSFGKGMDLALNKERRVDLMRLAAAKLFNNKWPTLSALHEKLFEDDFNAHDALEDVLALERCWNEMVKRKLI